MKKAPLPVEKAGHAVVALNGLIYVLGGNNGSGYHPTSEVLVYDPSKDSWTCVSCMQLSRERFCAVACDGLIYAMNGHNDSDTSVEVYNPDNDTWWYVRNTPVPHQLAGAAVANGIIYLVGGWMSRSDVCAYNPQNDTWWSVAPLNHNRQNLAAVSVNWQVYAIGGYRSGGGSSETLQSVEVYDARQNKWTDGPPMSNARSNPGAVSIGERYIVVTGGGVSSTAIYDRTTRSWSALAPSPFSRQFIGAAYLKGFVYAIGGSNGFIAENEYKDNDALDVSNLIDAVPPEISIYDVPEDTWISTTNMTFQGHVSDDQDLRKVEARLNDGNWTDCSIGGTDWSHHFDLNVGTDILCVRAFDAAGNVNSTSVSFMVDPVPPSINITSPIGRSVVSSPLFYVSGTASDDKNLTMVEISRNCVNWVSCTGLEDWSANVTLASGQNVVYVRAVDRAGNTNLSAILVYLDDVPPVVVISPPAKLSVSRPLISLSGNVTDDVEVKQIEINVNGVNWTPLSGNSSWTVNVSLNVGANSIDVRAFDTMGNRGNATIVVTYLPKKPHEATPGFEAVFAWIALAGWVVATGGQRIGGRRKWR